MPSAPNPTRSFRTLTLERMRLPTRIGTDPASGNGLRDVTQEAEACRQLRVHCKCPLVGSGQTTVLVGSHSTSRECVKVLFSLKDSNFHHPLLGSQFFAERELALCFVLVMEHTLPLISHWVFKSFRRATHDIKSLSQSRLRVKCMSLLIAVFLCCAVLCGTTPPS